ncbi:MAG TPA: AAA family ATPase [Phycisphaerae bacterium]|nr:AAA family ATPase [Phycisphaerae bacterium]
MADVIGLTFSGFRCLGEVTISPLRKTNILVGKNGVGKSSVLDLLTALPSPDNWQTGPVKLPQEAVPLGSEPRVEIVTRLTDEDYDAVIQPFRKKAEAQGVSSEQIASDVGALRDAGVLREYVWVFEGAPIPVFKEFRVTDTEGQERICARTLNENEMRILSYEALRDYFVGGIRRGPANDFRLAEQRIPLKRLYMGSSLPENLNLHVAAVRRFLGMRRFRLAAQRKGTHRSQATTEEQLAQDGNNLARRLFTIKNNEPKAFKQINDFMESLMPGIGLLGTPVSGGEFSLVWEEADGAKVPTAQSGTGLEQLLMLSLVLFAEHHQGLVLLEEPENNLHPGAQEKILKALRESSHAAHVFIASHSPVFAQASEDTCLVSMRIQEGGQTEGRSVSGEEVATVFDDLGIRASHLALADILVLTEGISTVGAVREWKDKWSSLGAFRDAVRIVVHQFQPSDVRNPDFNIDELLALNRNLVFFLDRDENPSGGPTGHDSLQEACDKHDPPVQCVRLKRVRAFEDIIPASAISKVCSEIRWEYDPDGEGSPVEQFRAAGGQWSKSYNTLAAKDMSEEDMRQVPEVAELMEAITNLAAKIAPPTPS